MHTFLLTGRPRAGSSNRVVMGSGYSGKAILGAYNGTVTSWADLYISPAALGNVIIGKTTSSGKLLQVGGTVEASRYDGPGTGLTGYAGSLAVGFADSSSYADDANYANDSGTVGGIQPCQIVYGTCNNGINSLSSSTDNPYELPQYKAGFWEANGKNYMPDTGWYWGATFAHSSNGSSYNYSGQLAFKIGTGADGIYARTINGGTPTSWGRLLSQGNLGSFPVSASATGVVNNVSMQELGGVDKQINGVRIGKGGSNVGSNTVVGNGLASVTSGNYSTVMGNNAGLSLTTAGGAAFFGTDCGKANTTGYDNAAFGAGSQNMTSTGTQNVSMGSWSLSNITNGAGNTAIGHLALSNLSNTGNSSNNVALGVSAGKLVNGGASLTAASDCIYIGRGAVSSADGIFNEYVIGAGGIGKGSNTVAIGNSSTTNNYFFGNINASADVIAYTTSDRRLKDNIKPIEKPLEKLLKLSGNTFTWNDKQSTYTGNDVGVIAQEVEEVFPEIVETRDSGYKAVKYEKLVPLLIESIKELKKEVEDLKRRING
jgi:hypothetical protein